MGNDFYLMQEDLRKDEEPELENFEEEDLGDIDRAYEQMKEREDNE